MAAFKDGHVSKYYHKVFKYGKSFTHNVSCESYYILPYHNPNVDTTEEFRKIIELFKEHKLKEKG